MKATNVRLRLLRAKTLLGEYLPLAKGDPTVTRRVSITFIYYTGKGLCGGGEGWGVCGNKEHAFPRLFFKYNNIITLFTFVLSFKIPNEACVLNPELLLASPHPISSPLNSGGTPLLQTSKSSFLFQLENLTKLVCENVCDTIFACLSAVFLFDKRHHNWWPVHMQWLCGRMQIWPKWRAHFLRMSKEHMWSIMLWMLWRI